MKTTTLGCAIVLGLFLVPLACGSKQDPPPQPNGMYGQQPGQVGYGTPGDPNQPPQYGPQQQPYPGQPQQQPYPGQPQQQPPPGQPQPTAAPAQTAPPASNPIADQATAAAVKLALTPRAANEAKGMKEDGAPLAGMLQEGGVLTQELMLMPGKCYTILGQAFPPVAELDMQLSAKPIAPMLPQAVLAQDSQTGPSSSIGAGKSCYKNPFPIAAPAILTVKATRGSGPAGAQVYSK